MGNGLAEEEKGESNLLKMRIREKGQQKRMMVELASTKI